MLFRSLERPGSVGRPFPHLSIEILDEEGRSCPPRTEGEVWFRQPGFLVYKDDPEKTAHEVAPHVTHSVNTYSQWNSATAHPLYGGGKQVTPEEMIRNGPLKVFTPDQCIAMLEKISKAAPIEGVYGFIPPAGYPLKKLAEHVELFATKVMPHFR